MLIYNGQIIAGGGTIVLPMTRAEYEANKAILDSADVWVDLTDEPDSVATADQIAYSVDNVQKGMGYIGDIATKAIAKVEPTDTALYLHEVETGFINKNGDYCITDVEISVGGTIVLGTNCHVVDGGISGNLSRIATVVPDMSNLSDIKSSITSSSGYTALDDGFIVFQIIGAHNSSIRFDLLYDNQTIFAYQSGPSSTAGIDRTLFSDFKPINKGQVVKMGNKIFDLSVSSIYFAPIKA